MACAQLHRTTLEGPMRMSWHLAVRFNYTTTRATFRTRPRIVQIEVLDVSRIASTNGCQRIGSTK